MNRIDTFIKRLAKLGITIELFGNYPWIYLYSVNGIVITEKFESEHGFTIAYHPLRPGDILEFININEIFKIIRKYK